MSTNDGFNGNDWQPSGDTAGDTPQTPQTPPGPVAPPSRASSDSPYAPQSPYTPQSPYAAPQSPYGAPQTPYGAPQTPYGAPLAAGAPGQQSYGANWGMSPLTVQSNGTLTIGGGDAPARKWLAPLLIALVVAVILASVGGFFIWKKLAAHGGQPESAVPATAVAYAEVDLDPSADQKLKIRSQLNKFPALKAKLGNDTDLKEALLKAVLNNNALIDYASDIKPWLGDRAAVAVLPGVGGKPEVLLLLQHKDKAKAETAMRKLFAALSMRNSSTDSVTPSGGLSDNMLGMSTMSAMNGFSAEPKAYVVGDEYIVMGSSQAAVNDAVASAKQSSLANSKAYSDDLGSLGKDQIITAWADGDAAKLLIASAVPTMAQAFQATGSDKLGRYIMGVHAFDSGFELSARVIGATPTPGMKAHAPDLITSLPGTTAGALYIAEPGALVAHMFKALQSSMPAQVDAIKAAAAKQGITLPTDVVDLLGTDVVAGMSPVSGDASPSFGVRARPTDAQQSLDLLKRVGATQPSYRSVVEGLKKDGKDLVWTSPGAYGAAFTAQSGGLGANAHFKKAMAMDGDVYEAFFIDSSIAGAGYPKDVPGGAIGFTATQSGDNVLVATLRVVID